jgi:putative ABC transport system ATP-binding protein
MIVAEDVTKDYIDGETVVHALRGVSLQVDQGEFISIAGPSGSGKSTLLNIIGCIDTASGGRVRIDEEEVTGHAPRELTLLRRRKIGFVFQSFNLIPVLTAYENVAFSLMLLGLDDSEAEPRVRAILEEVGLAGMEDRLPAKLSGGQQQRVAVARALVKEPTIVLADEPTANLDSDTGQSILELMRELNRRRETTFIFSTHDRMVMDFADRLALLHDGRIVEDNRRTA